MPTINLKLNRQHAVAIYQSIEEMNQGEGKYKAAREQIQRAILKVWPEITDAGTHNPPEMTREIEYNPKQQRAMAEGILALCNLDKTNGNKFAALRKLSEVTCVWPFVDFYLSQKPLEDYDFPLTGEPLMDEPGTEE